MNKFTLVFVAVAMAVALVPSASANQFRSIAVDSSARFYPAFAASVLGFSRVAATTPFDSTRRVRESWGVSSQHIADFFAIAVPLNGRRRANPVAENGAGGVVKDQQPSFGSAQGSTAQRDGSGNDASRADSSASGDSSPLTGTPEPGSLFLLGAGLLGLAMVLFWKSAGRPTGHRESN